MNSKLELRIEAARLSVESGAEDFTAKATEIYHFIEGNSNLPEYYNPMDEMRTKLKDIYNNTGLNNERKVDNKKEEAKTISEC